MRFLIINTTSICFTGAYDAKVATYAATSCMFGTPYDSDQRTTHWPVRGVQSCPSKLRLISSAKKQNSLPPVNWRWVEEGDGYVRHCISAAGQQRLCIMLLTFHDRHRHVLMAQHAHAKAGNHTLDAAQAA
jgi:hypothetical protein